MLGSPDWQRRWVIGRIMCHAELRADEFEDRFGASLANRFARELAQLDQAVEDGLVERSPDGSLLVTPVGRLLVRNVAMVFDGYLADQQRASQPMFSKTV